MRNKGKLLGLPAPAKTFRKCNQLRFSPNGFPHILTDGLKIFLPIGTGAHLDTSNAECFFLHFLLISNRTSARFIKVPVEGKIFDFIFPFFQKLDLLRVIQVVGNKGKNRRFFRGKFEHVFI